MKNGLFESVMLLRTFRQPKAVESGTAEKRSKLQFDGRGKAKSSSGFGFGSLHFSPSIGL